MVTTPPREEKRPTALLICGMHRSGTSALSRICNLHGASLGRTLAGSAPDNEKGFWENTAVTGLNEKILQSLGLGWDSVQSLPTAWASSDLLAPFRRRAADVVAQEFPAALVATKDPRLSRLLPFWLPILTAGGYQPRVVIALRHPSEVAESLKARNGISRARSYLLWLLHTLEAARDAPSEHSCFVHYQAVLREPATVIDGLRERLGIEWSRTVPEAAQEVARFLDPGLRHHRFASEIVSSGSSDIDRMVASVQAAIGAQAVTATDSAMLDERSLELVRLISQITREEQHRSESPAQRRPPRSQPAPLNFLHLSFQSLPEYNEYQQQNVGMLNSTWLWHETLGNQPDPISTPGLCDLCLRNTTYKSSPVKDAGGDPFAYRVAWRMAAHCDCGFSALERSLVRVLYEYGVKDSDRLYHLGQRSRSYHWLKERFPNLAASQYVEGAAPGQIVDDGSRHEDLTQLTYRSASFDAIYCCEILEHIPDYQQALRECARVLRRGGVAAFSFPYDLSAAEHLTRAELLPDGTVRHLLPPEYHGDPAREEGILCYRVYGWRVLDEMRSAGFSRASVDFIFGPVHGYMTLIHPLIIGIR